MTNVEAPPAPRPIETIRSSWPEVFWQEDGDAATPRFHGQLTTPFGPLVVRLENEGSEWVCSLAATGWARPQHPQGESVTFNVLPDERARGPLSWWSRQRVF